MSEPTLPIADERLLIPPHYCAYASGPCDQVIPAADGPTYFFAYPSEPEELRQVVQGAATKLQALRPDVSCLSWQDLPIAGRSVFCEICKAVRSSVALIADVTTLNFNVLFELGLALGLGIPVIPIRDPSYSVYEADFRSFSLLDTTGYLSYVSSQELAEKLQQVPLQPLPVPHTRAYRNAPVYLIRSPVATNGVLALAAALKKSALAHRAYDPIETPRLALSEARRQVHGSFGVVAHLLGADRQGARAHNATCALVSGMALAQAKPVLLLSSSAESQPLDYRDIVKVYQRPAQIPALLGPFLEETIKGLQGDSLFTLDGIRNRLEAIDLGDLAAENEISGLDRYFVTTGQWTRARQGHARLVVGRKGSGKTAIFYRVRDDLRGIRHVMVLDLKPEGHQFARFHDDVLSRLTPGVREHTMVAFWNYILLAELARTIIGEWQRVRYDPVTRAAWEKVETAYAVHNPGYEADFSQRLLIEVNRIAESTGGQEIADIGDRITEILFRGDIASLTEAVSEYLSIKDEVWLLIDNLDKGWPTRATSSGDVLVLRALLEATRKLQRRLDESGVDFRCLVFIRTDLHEHLLSETPDQGKDTAIRLDWDDPRLFEEIVRRRIASSLGVTGDFREIWSGIADLHVDARDSFGYIVERTMMRPRDVLLFVHTALDVAINRGHERITSDDFKQAERAYSETLLRTTASELSDTNPDLIDLLYVFQGCPTVMGRADVEQRLRTAGIDSSDLQRVFELLLWFSVFGIRGEEGGEERYSYDVQFNIRRLVHAIDVLGAKLILHPGFRAALDAVPV